MATESSWSVLEIVALVAAVLAPPIGVVLGVVALLRVRSANPQGGGIAIAAIVVGGVLCVAIALGVAAWTSFTVEYTSTVETVDLKARP